MELDKCISKLGNFLADHRDIWHASEWASVRMKWFKMETDYRKVIRPLLTLLKSLKEMSGVVPEKKEIAQMISSYIIKKYYWDCCKEDFEDLAKAIRSQLLLGLAGFKERLPKIIENSRLHQESQCVGVESKNELVRAILVELLGKKEKDVLD